MKTYTDVEQGKKLAKVLPSDSPDRWHQYCGTDDSGEPVYTPVAIRDHESDKDIPSWTYLALIEAIMRYMKESGVHTINGDGFSIQYDEHRHNLDFDIPDLSAVEDFIDAHVEVVLKLYERKPRDHEKSIQRV